MTKFNRGDIIKNDFLKRTRLVLDNKLHYKTIILKDETSKIKDKSVQYDGIALFDDTYKLIGSGNVELMLLLYGE